MVYGIVAEYNPFHQGHKYLIDQVKTESDLVIAVMSGNFVQRGDFAVLPKWERAKDALQNGVDLVIELPTPFAIKSAPGFAQAAVQILQSLGCVDKLLFGAETADVMALGQVAAFLNSEAYHTAVAQEVKKGISFPAAKQNAVDSPLLLSPNNLLAVEYLKALQEQSSHITPVAVQRIGSGHNAFEEGEYPSASYLRAQMNPVDIATMERCQLAVLSKLRTLTPSAIGAIEDVSEGLENRIIKAVNSATTLEELYTKIKSKRYTHARIRRIILRAYLGISRDEFPAVPYLKVLGFTNAGSTLLGKIRHSATLPLLQQHSDVKNMSSACQSLYYAECSFTDQFAMGFSPIRPCGMEMTTSVIKINNRKAELE